MHYFELHVACVPIKWAGLFQRDTPTVHPRGPEMNKKSKLGAAQKFPEASTSKWLSLLQDQDGQDLFKPLLDPPDSASQLRVVKKVCSLLPS